ncbi:hypothetical protein [Sediminispirochaeta bajacaliforniensis]|uniref:hypothetical protein n=1 Tax=Sediminispirochaeta bajacaliforniensis TaxID=148 RepID=UPI00037229B9|nr:hypothetical protein [Sediminispirochaeta bajacaliforniensis]
MSLNRLQNAGGLLALAAVITVPLALMFQGLDFTDTGWLLTNYSLFFEHPEGARYWFHLWLTYCTGALWNIGFGRYGLIGMRLGAVVVYWLTAFVVYRLYAGKVGRNLLLLSLAIGLVGNFANRITIIHYNSLTVLLLSLTLLFLLRGIERKSFLSVLVAGFFAGANVFVRIPNVLFFAVALVIFFDAWIKRSGFRKHTIGFCLAFVLGILLSVLVIFTVMALLGQLPQYLESVKELVSFGNNDLTNYGAVGFERRFTTQNLSALGWGFLLLGLFFAISRIAEKINLQRFCRYGGIIVLAGGFFLLYIIGALNNLRYIMVGAAYLTCIAVLFGSPADRDGSSKQLAFMLLLSLLLLSTGSDTGISVSEYGLVLVLPLMLRFWTTYKERRREFSVERSSETVTYHFRLSAKTRYGIGLLLMAMCLLVGTRELWMQTYRDNDKRSAMTASVDHPLLRGVRTTPQRANVVGEVLDALQGYVKPGDPLLSFESVCMLHYLSGTIPFAGNAWPIQFTPEDFKRELAAGLSVYGKPPIVVIAKQETSSDGWPQEGSLRGSKMAVADRNVFYEFLDTHGYVPVWENETFMILEPSS